MFSNELRSKLLMNFKINSLFTEGLDRFVWFVGYENNFGSVSSVGGELDEETQKSLEREFSRI